MTRLKLVAALAAAGSLSLPVLAHAQDQDPCHGRRNEATAGGAVVGGLIGGVLGSNVAARHHRGDGTLAGAVVGGLIGSQVGRSNVKCYDDDAYGQGYGQQGYGPEGYASQGPHDEGRRQRDVAIYRREAGDNGDYAQNDYNDDDHGGYYVDQPAYGSSYDDGGDGRVEQRRYVIVHDDNGSDQDAGEGSYAIGPDSPPPPGGWTPVPGPDCASTCVTQDGQGYATAGDAAYANSDGSAGDGYYYTSASPGYSSSYSTSYSGGHMKHRYATQTRYRTTIYAGGYANSDDHGDIGFRDERGQWHEGAPRAIGWQDDDGNWHEGQVTATGWRDQDGGWHEQSSYSSSSSYSSGY